MVDATETLSRLSHKASKLNKLSDEINGIISTFEKKLAGMNLGIEVWYGDPDKDWFCNPEATWYGFTLKRDDAEAKAGIRESYIAVLGYCKNGDTWCLAVKEGIVKGRMINNEFQENFIEDKRYPLAEASRVIRMRAVGAMEQFFEAVEKKADELIAEIETGKQFVKSIE